jgi:hypothetical protein
VCKREAIRYLQAAVTRQACVQGAVHNCLLLLLVDGARADPAALMRYVAAGARLSRHKCVDPSVQDLGLWIQGFQIRLQESGVRS